MGHDTGRKKTKDTQAGSVVVEASIVLPVFIIAVFLIVNIMNILMLHNRIQFAINSSAHELASYSYVYSALNINGMEETVEGDGNPYTSKIDKTSNQILDCLDQIQALSKGSGDIDAAAESGVETYKSVKDLLSDPKSLAIGAGYIAAEAGMYEAKKGIATMIIRELSKKYLDQGDISADEYLQQYGVKAGYGGLDFKGTTMLNDNNHQIIDVVVQYDIDLIGFSLIIDTPKLHVVQRVSVSAWLDGDGKSPESYGVRK